MADESFQHLPFERPIAGLENRLRAMEGQDDRSAETLAAIRDLREEIARFRREVFSNLDPWDTVLVSRHPDRPQTLDYIELLFDEFIELHGDRTFRDDRAILTGFAKLDGIKLLFVGQHKGRNLEERRAHNFGMAHPEGYRKALLKMQLAAKFGLPIICFIDTGGAYPGIAAEERGQAFCIARNVREISGLRTPIVCVVIGEGGGDGAMGIGMGDHVSVLEFAYYSVLAPEGCARLLWDHVKFRDVAARALKLTAHDLLEFGVIDEIVPEPLGGAHRDHHAMAQILKTSLTQNLKDLSSISIEDLLNRRYQKFRRMGAVESEF